jgi:hypothetical protein
MMWKRVASVVGQRTSRWLNGFLAVAVLLGAYTAWDYVNARRVTAAIVTVAHSGGSINRADIERTNSNADEASDAAPFYLAAATLASTSLPYGSVALAQSPGFSGVPAPAELQDWYLTGDVPVALLQHTKAVLDGQADSLRLLSTATSRPFAGFARTTTYGAQILQFEQLCSLCSMRTVYAAATGNAQLAVESLRSELALFADPGRPVHRTPLPRVLVSALGLSLLLNRNALDEMQLESLALAFGPADDDRIIDRQLDALRGNFIEAVLDRARYFDGFSLFVGGLPGETGVVLRPQLASRVTQQLDSYRGLIASGEHPWTTRLDDLRAVAIQRQWRDDGGFLVNHGWSSDPWGFTALPLNLEAARVARAAIAIERFRLDHNGQLPDTLDQTVPTYLPAVPIDPYSGRPIRFVKIDGGYEVYGVSFDRADNGGDLLKDQPVIRVRR